jgi:hypothetical protein
MAKQTTAVERIEACVQGKVSGQIAIGKHILQIGSVHGGIVNVAVPEEQPRPGRVHFQSSFDRGRFPVF